LRSIASSPSISIARDRSAFSNGVTSQSASQSCAGSWLGETRSH
jgi:hypothetical protein